MTRIAQGNQLTVLPNETIFLELFEVDGVLMWFYSESIITVNAPNTYIRIALINRTAAKAAIIDYASTGVSQDHSPIGKFDASPDGQSAVFPISLLPNQLIDFGVFVSIVGDNIDRTIFCDPQASNDPIKTRAPALDGSPR